MASSSIHRTYGLCRCNDEFDKLHDVGKQYSNTVESDHQGLVEEGDAERWVDNFDPRTAKSCRNHYRDYVETAALRPPTTQQWESVKDMIYELYIERGFSLEDVKRERGASSHVFKVRIPSCSFGKNALDHDWQLFNILPHRTFAVESQLRQVDIHGKIRTALESNRYLRQLNVSEIEFAINAMRAHSVVTKDVQWAAATPVCTEQNTYSYEDPGVKQSSYEHSAGGDHCPVRCPEYDRGWFRTKVLDWKRHEVLGDCGRGFTVVNDLNRYERTAHIKSEQGAQVYQYFSVGYMDFERGGPRKDNFKSHLRKLNPSEDEDDHSTEYIAWWFSIMNKPIKFEMLWQGGLRELPGCHRLVCTIGFVTLGGRVMSYPQEMEISKTKDGAPWNAADTADFAICRSFKQSEDFIRQRELTVCVLGETGAGELIIAFIRSRSLLSLDDVMRDKERESIIPCTSTSWSVPVNIHKGPGASPNDTRQMCASSTLTYYSLQCDHLVRGTEYHAKKIDREDIPAQKPQPPPVRMSPDDDDDDESYGFRRAQSRHVNWQNKEWRAVIARVCDPFSRATEHGMGRVCRGTFASDRRVTRFPFSAEGNTVEAY